MTIIVPWVKASAGSLHAENLDLPVTPEDFEADIMRVPGE
jgi:hypothetical protein